ncbi:MAG: hypothetical protein MJZ55_00460 [Paludibacteraceae bacterium]|nr:hypothetical protein [Paludibacteraceae bacterium]
MKKKIVYIALMASVWCVAQDLPTDFSKAEPITVCTSEAGNTVKLCTNLDGDYLVKSWWQYYDGQWTQLPDDSACAIVTLPTDTTKDIYYYFYGERILSEQIVNGDFEQGNIGFASEYGHVDSTGTSTLYPEGVYTITSAISGVHSSAPKPECDHDHTTGHGKMMAVNGGQDTGKKVWAQTVNGLQPNTNYAFSAWVMNWDRSNINLALLEFSINDELQGRQFSPEGGYGHWTQLYTIWNSGNSTTADIKLINQQSASQGNDFAVDDIHFSQVEQATRFVHYSFVTCTIPPPPEPCVDSLVYRKWSDFMFCDNSDSSFVSYQWYCDSVAIPGATKQYLYLGKQPQGEYYVVATKTTGKKITTCAYSFDQLPPSAGTEKQTTAIRKVIYKGHLYIENNNKLYNIVGGYYAK